MRIGGHTLVAISQDRTSLRSVDLPTGQVSTQAQLDAGQWLPSPGTFRGLVIAAQVEAGAGAAAASGPGAGAGQAGLSVVAVDLSGRTVENSLVAPGETVRNSFAVAGVGSSPSTSNLLLLDEEGRVAFVTSSGAVGVASLLSPVPGRTVSDAELGGAQVLSDICPARRGAGPTAAPIVGMAPLGPNALIVGCASGAVVTILGEDPGAGASPAALESASAWASASR